MKKFSLFNICDLLYLPIAWAFYKLCEHKWKWQVFVLLLIFYVALFVIQSLFKTKVFNESNKVLWAKPEEGDEPHTIQANENCDDVDGINLEGRVFKLPNGLPITVKDDGVHNHSLTGWILYSLMGREFTGWKKLFDAK